MSAGQPLPGRHQLCRQGGRTPADTIESATQSASFGRDSAAEIDRYRRGGDRIAHLVGAPQRHGGRPRRSGRSTSAAIAGEGAAWVAISVSGRNRRAARSTPNCRSASGRSAGQRQSDRPSSTGIRNAAVGAQVATAGAISATLVVHDTIAPQPEQHDRQRRETQEVQQAAETERGRPTGSPVTAGRTRSDTDDGQQDPQPARHRRQHPPRNMCDPHCRQHQHGQQPDRHPSPVDVNSSEIPKTTISFVPAQARGRRSAQAPGAAAHGARRAAGSGASPAGSQSRRRGRADAGSSRPSRRCRMRGHSSSSPAKSCEMTTTVSPGHGADPRASRTRPRWLAASSPASGSSRISTRGERASSPASTTRRIWPPLSWSMRRFASAASRPTTASAAVTRA